MSSQFRANHRQQSNFFRAHGRSLSARERASVEKREAALWLKFTPNNFDFFSEQSSPTVALKTLHQTSADGERCKLTLVFFGDSQK